VAPPSPASPSADRIADVYWLILAFAAVVFLAVAIPLALFIVRFRSRGRSRDVEGPQIRGNTSLELAWTVAPVLILVVIGGYVFYKLPGINEPAAAGERSALTVDVEGRQFYWRFRYPSGGVSFDTLRLPVNRTTTLRITAPDWDVAHSFWVPELAGKRDAIPGQTTSMDIRPVRTGSFELKCAEFCGVQHAAMLGTVEVLPIREFAAWLSRQGQTTPAALGAQIYGSVCAKCHGPDVAGEIGPKLEGNPIVADPTQVRTVVTQGIRTMPAVGRGWSNAELRGLTTFLRQSVAKQGGGGGG
jgi:cytochrome c oxidase subunit II